MTRSSHDLSITQRFAIALLALFAAFSGERPARAESDASVQSWRIIVPQRAAPAPAAQTYRARRRYDAPRPRFPDDATLGLTMPEFSITAPAPPDTARTKIAIIGDSLAEALLYGMEADPALKAELLIRSKTVSASGLVREDYHDWPKAISQIIAENPGLAALVVMVGVNDRQAIRVGDATLEPLTEPWREAYRKRIDAVISVAQAARVPLVWVGLPIMRTPRLSADVASFNEMARDRVSTSGETFIDIFDSFADQSGAYSATGPDVIGDTVRLRGPDGIHFTPAGQRKLAFFVEKPLRKRIGERPQPEAGASLAALPIQPSVQPSTTPAEVSLPLPAATVAPISIVRPRVDIGEVRSLTSTATASTLIGRQTKPLDDPATRDLFDRGLSPTPRDGRSDDYRWR